MAPTTEETNIENIESEFFNKHSGKLYGILNEKDYLKLGESLSDSWYGLDFSQEKLSVLQMNGDEAGKIMKELYTILRSKNLRNITFPYTYVSNRDNPDFIKIYDPMKCGSSCSVKKPDPSWILTMILPTDTDLEKLRPREKKNLLKKALIKSDLPFQSLKKLF